MTNSNETTGSNTQWSETSAQDEATDAVLEEQLAPAEGSSAMDEADPSPMKLPPVKFIAVEAIKSREQDLRTLSADHVVDMAMSFVAVGLLQFPVVDQNDVLLAGAHRREAVALLKAWRGASLEEIRSHAERDPEGDPLSDDDLRRIQGTYDKYFSRGIVVHVLDTSGMDEADIQLKVETIENEKRKDFTKDELMRIVSRLEDAGYKRTAGRPKPGQRVLSVELGRMIGKSRATVFRFLKELKEPRQERTGPSPVSVELARKASAQLDTKVQVRESASNREAGIIVIHYNSFRQRGSLLRALNLKD